MPLTLLSGLPAIGMVGAVAAAGWAGQDCLLLAGSMVLAHRLFLVRLDRGALWHALTAAVNALTAGALRSNKTVASVTIMVKFQR